MIPRSQPTAVAAPRRGRFFLASGLGVSLLLATGVALAQIQPGTGQAPSAPGADVSAAPSQAAIGSASQSEAAQVAPDRVIVTGSFIPTAEGEGALPVANVTADDLRKLGATSATEGLRRLPSFVGAATTEADSNGGSGRAGVNLRGLGEQNVLVLINGHRAGNPSIGVTGLGGGFTDANLIPFSAIDHIEVLKDGASAQYGSDAVAGVVNYILKTEFQGVQVDFLYGNTTNNDASTVRASAITGFSTKDKRFNIVLDANYYHANAIFSRDRFLSSLADARRFGGSNGGSPSFPGRIQVATGSASAATAGATNLILADQSSVPLPAGAVLTTDGTPAVGAASYRPYDPDNDPFNFRLFTPAIPEQERFAYYGATDYQIIPNNVLDLYAYGLYSNNRQYNGLAPSPFVDVSASLAAAADAGVPLAQDLIAQYGSAINVLRASPYNPVGDDLTRVRYRSLELGPRLNLFDTRAYEGVVGVKGDIKTFTYDLTLSHTETKIVQSVRNDVRSSIVAQEIALGNFNPFVGVGSPRAGTVVTADGVTHTFDNLAALQRASYYGDIISFDNQNFAEARLTNTFFPDAPQGGVSVAVGGEYRREAFDLQTDPILLSGDTVGGFNASAAYHAVQDVRSVFGQLLFPVVAPTMNIPGIYSLSFGVAGRYQKFYLDGVDPLTNAPTTPTFETTNPKYEVRYQPIQDVTLRGSYSTSFRAPSLVNLFQPAVVAGNSPAIRDPFAQATGQDPNVQPNDTTTGNPNLQPETTDSYTAGIVLSPRFVPGLNITVDYYQINQSNLIINGGSVAQFYVNQNFFSGGAQFSDLIVRDPDTGALLSVIERPFNAAQRRIEGLDVTASYQLDTQALFKRDFGRFNFTLNYNHFFRFNAEVSAGTGSTDFLGTFSNAPLTPGSIPYNKALAQFEYIKDLPPLGILPKSTVDFVATVNYIGDYLDDGSLVAGGQSPITDANGNVPDPANPRYAINRKVREYTTLDLQLSYTIQAPEKVEAVTTTAKDGKDGKRAVTSPGTSPSLLQRLLGGTTLTVGCNDVFDTPPPFSAGAFNDNYDTSLYTIRNRFVYGAISKKF